MKKLQSCSSFKMIVTDDPEDFNTIKESNIEKLDPLVYNTFNCSSL